MRTNHAIDAAIDEIARPTLNLVHARDLRTSIVSRARIKSRIDGGAMSRLLPGTYLHAPRGTTPSFEQECMAGTLAGGEGSVIDGTAGALLRGWWNRRVDHIDVTLRDRVLRSGRGRWRFHRSTQGLWLPDESTFVGPIPVAHVHQILVTAAATGSTPWQIAFMMSEAIRDGATSPPSLRELVEQRKGWRGIATVRAALSIVERGSWGTRGFTEDCYVAEFVRREMPIPLVNVRGAMGLVRDEPDFVWRELLANVESDGGHHDHPAQREDDRRRDDEAMARGWRVLRVRVADFFRAREHVMASIVRFLRGDDVPLIPGTRILFVP